jgi:hypothetical protein
MLATSSEARIAPQPSGASSLGDASASLSSGLVTARIVLVATFV